MNMRKRAGLTVPMLAAAGGLYVTAPADAQEVSWRRLVRQHGGIADANCGEDDWVGGGTCNGSVQTLPLDRIEPPRRRRSPQ